MKRYAEGFALLLRDIRLSEGLTQEEIAEVLEVPIATVRGWEHAYCLPKAKNWRKLKEHYQGLKAFSDLEKAYLSGKRLSRV